jgi:PAS domain S-box-containing protein
MAPDGHAGLLAIVALMIGVAGAVCTLVLLGARLHWGRRRAADARDLDKLRTLLRDYIAERELTEEQLQESEERYRSLIGRAYYGIYRSSVDGRFLEVTEALVRMLGYESADELLQLDIGQALYIDAADRDQIVQLARMGGPLPDWTEVKWRRKDRSAITVRITAQPRYTRTGSIEYFEGIVEDVTARHRQEEMLRRSERMASLGTTLAGVAHELNNPLTAVIGFAQIMLREERSEDDRAGLETIHREAARAARIVKDLLTFTRRQEATRPGRVDVNAVVEYIVSTRRYALETRGVRCLMHLAPEMPLVAGDASQMEQVLLNLLVNAEHALSDALDAPRAAEGDTSPRGTIEIGTVVDRDTVVIEVSDTGCGIPPEDLTRIWDPFWTTKAEGEGTGLGLSVVHGIVSAHGGSIEVETAVGSGTTFTLRFPRSRDDASKVTPIRGAATVNASYASRPLDVLVIDDEASITTFLSQYLGSRGHAVLTAQSGPQALSIARSGEFDVVVCDLRMPGMDGLETMRALRAMPNGDRPRYILSTGATMGAAVIDAAEALRVDAVVPKPYDIEQLRRAVEHASEL